MPTISRWYGRRWSLLWTGIQRLRSWASPRMAPKPSPRPTSSTRGRRPRRAHARDDRREALARLKAELPDARVLLISAHEEPDVVVDAVSSGAAGFLLKRMSGDELAEAVLAVHAGEAVLTPELTAHLVRGLRRGEEPQAPNGANARLTPSETKVLRLVAEGQSDKQISSELNISPRTVQSHLVQIRAKVGLRRRVELTRWAATHLLV